MSDDPKLIMPPSSPDLSRKAAIVGVGESNFYNDYKDSRAKLPGYEPPTLEQLYRTAFSRALADSGLRREDIDGVSISMTYGGPTPHEVAANLAIRPQHVVENNGYGIMAGPLPVVSATIASGKCDTVAMIYAVASRSGGRIFGGQTHESGAAPPSYYYYHPWGWSSQGAHWAMVWRHYQNAYGATEADLGAVAVQLREHALTNSNAIMQKPLSIEDYLASRYIVRPLHLFDMCLVNDGAVCLIVRRSDMAKDMKHTPVLVAGWAEAKIKHKTDKMQILVRERLRPLAQAASADTFAMAGLAPSDVKHFEAYDASTIHLISQLEGFGFAGPGEGLEFCKAGGMALGGAMPTNVNGGMLSGSYMHGWNHVAEITRQLRHEAGARQIRDLETSLFCLAQTDQVHPILFTRGA